MSKWVEVTVTVTKIYAIEVDDGDDWDDEDMRDDARETALDQYCGDDVEIVSAVIAKNSEQVEQMKRLADERIAL